MLPPTLAFANRKRETIISYTVSANKVNTFRQNFWNSRLSFRWVSGDRGRLRASSGWRNFRKKGQFLIPSS
jgi:hypothetical protein